MLSLKTAQHDELFARVRQDPWILQNITKLPASSLVPYIADTYQCGENTAEDLTKMLVRDFTPTPPTLSLKAAQQSEPEEVDQAVKQIVEDIKALTVGDVLKACDSAKRIRGKEIREAALKEAISLSKELVHSIRREAQSKQIVIPPTADNPTSRTVTLRDKEMDAPDPTKVPVGPDEPAEKKEVIDTSIDDNRKTRQEQLANSFRAMDVVLKDFVQAMYGLELNHEYMGKLIESIIDKASDLAAQQTADTVKQLASPFIGQ